MRIVTMAAPRLYLTKYEMCEVVSMRALMIYDGAPILLAGTDFCTERDDVLEIARMELVTGKLQFRISRATHNDVTHIDSSHFTLESNF